VSSPVASVGARALRPRTKLPLHSSVTIRLCKRRDRPPEWIDTPPLALSRAPTSLGAGLEDHGALPERSDAALCPLDLHLPPSHIAWRSFSGLPVRHCGTPAAKIVHGLTNQVDAVVLQGADDRGWPYLLPTTVSRRARASAGAHGTRPCST